MTESEPRAELLRALERYAARHPVEAGTAARFAAFVSSRADCFSRSCGVGHVTGSAFIHDPEGARALFVHHAKLDLWLQPGGHCEPGETALEAALREAEEETGLRCAPESAEIFDLDDHVFPARGPTPAHVHWDVRYLLRPESGELRGSAESRAVEWLAYDEAARRTPGESIRRPIAKLRKIAKLRETASEARDPS